MTDYISREAALELLTMALEDDWETGYAADRMMEVPAADVRENVIRTQADRIRAMSDEELAAFIERSDCPPHGNWVCDYENRSCVHCWLDWLRSPVGGDGNE